MNKVIVAGSINMDIVALTKNHPKVGETVFGTDLKYFPGGKGANQAVSAAKLGAQVIMAGMVGGDSFGNTLSQFLEQEGVTNEIGVAPGHPTGTAIITVSTETSDNTIVVIPGANFQLTAEHVTKIPMEQNDILVSQFEIPLSVISAFFRKGRTFGTTNILNPAPAQSVPSELLDLVDVLVLNETELEVLSNSSVDVDDIDTIALAVQQVKRSHQSIIVTLGKNGALGFNKDGVVRIEGRRVAAVDTTGAGDCFVGAFASQLANGVSLTDAMEFANTAASICVTRQGAGPSMPTIQEVESALSLFQ